MNRVGLDTSLLPTKVDFDFTPRSEVGNEEIVDEETNSRCVCPDGFIIIEILEDVGKIITGWCDSLGKVTQEVTVLRDDPIIGSDIDDASFQEVCHYGATIE